jgi:hypothetical protein
MRIVLGLALALLGSPAFCATVSILGAAASATVTDAAGNLVLRDSQFPFLADTAKDGRAVSAQADLQSEGYNFAAKTAGDIRTGAFSGSAEKGAGFGEVLAGSGTYEEFTARGTGDVTFRMNLGGWWDTEVTGSVVQNPFFLSSYVQFVTPDGVGSSSDFSVNSLDPGFEPAGTVSHTLTYTAQVADGATYAVATGIDLLFLGTASGSATGAAALSGLLSYAANDGVHLEFADREFLVAPIPLPAGWLLVVSAAGAVLTLRRTRRRIPEAA